MNAMLLKYFGSIITKHYNKSHQYIGELITKIVVSYKLTILICLVVSQIVDIFFAYL